MKRFLIVLRYLLAAHVVTLALLSAYRIVFHLALGSTFSGDEASVAPAYLRGIWFDNVVCCYVLLLPLAVLAVGSALGRGLAWIVRIAKWWLAFAFGLVSMAAAANVPYFEYFGRTLNSGIWQWFAYPAQTAGMLFGEAAWLKYIVLYFVLLILYATLLTLLSRSALRSLSATPRESRWRRNIATLAISLPLLGLCIFGIRGRTGYNPIKVSQAYYCDNPTLNQMGLNAAFCLVETTLDDAKAENRTLHLTEADAAVGRVKLWLGREGLEGISPLARRVVPAAVSDSLAPTFKGRNVVVVLMESLSANLMARFGNGNRLTPALDSLYRSGIAFSNFYSAGNHTNHGIYATLYGFPSILKRNAMKGSRIPLYSGLPTVLREKGYRTLFFMTHESQYDNMNAFLRTNGFDEIYAQENYPREKIVNHFGVSDDYLFSYALPVLDERARSGHPFFATLLTISNHPPYVVPPYFSPHSSSTEEQIVEYADWAIGRFMAEAARRPWYDRTIFVFLGDHGKKMGDSRYEIPDGFNHVPLIICGKDIPARELDCFGGQVDVAPTLLGLLGADYVQNNFGIDLLREQRPGMMFYSADNVVACRSSNALFIYNPDADRQFCYDISLPERFVPQPFSERYAPLKEYVFSNLQAAETLVQAGQTTDKPRHR